MRCSQVTFAVNQIIDVNFQSSDLLLSQKKNVNRNDMVTNAYYYWALRCQVFIGFEYKLVSSCFTQEMDSITCDLRGHMLARTH